MVIKTRNNMERNSPAKELRCVRSYEVLEKKKEYCLC